MCSDFANGFNNSGITAVCILRKTSNAGLWKEEQRAKGGIDGQLKVGPTHGVPAGAPATNGESRTYIIPLNC